MSRCRSVAPLIGERTGMGCGHLEPPPVRPVDQPGPGDPTTRKASSPQRRSQSVQGLATKSQPDAQGG